MLEIKKEVIKMQGETGNTEKHKKHYTAEEAKAKTTGKTCSPGQNGLLVLATGKVQSYCRHKVW
jgi:hypothetical protein